MMLFSWSFHIHVARLGR